MGQKNVALGALGARLVTLLQDHNSVLHIAVQIVNPGVGTV